LNDTDIVSVVLTVKTSKALLAALTGKMLPDSPVARVVSLALSSALTGCPDPADGGSQA
jgi:hypothetical protein